MKIKNSIVGLMTLAVIASGGVYSFGQEQKTGAYTGSQYAREAKISLEEARTRALKAFRGKIVAEELEREKGGSGLRYSFDIRRDGVTQEVGIDAKTGEVLENAPEGPNPD